MKRFTTLLLIIFSRWGFIAFMLYFCLLYLIILNISPVEYMQSISLLIKPYYVSIRYVSSVTNIIILIMAIRFILKFIKKERYVIRKKTLSFVIAISIIQLLSFFCYTNLPPIGVNTEQLVNLYKFSERFRIGILENLALLVTGYILAFYMGALSRGKFYRDVVFATKSSNK